MTIEISIRGGGGDIATWAANQKSGRNDAEFVLAAGAIPPDWFWAGVADGRITITGARLGDIVWGQDGIDFGERHFALGEMVRREDVEGA